MPRDEGHTIRRLADAITNPKQKVYEKFVLFDHVRPKNGFDKVNLLGEGFRLIGYIGRLFVVLMPNG